MMAVARSSANPMQCVFECFVVPSTVVDGWRLGVALKTPPREGVKTLTDLIVRQIFVVEG